MQTVLLIADERELDLWLGGGGEAGLAAAALAAAASAEQAGSRLRSRAFDCVCCDLEAVGLEAGLALQRSARQRNPDVEWLWIAPAALSEDELERLDGWPCVVKPLRPGRLPSVLSLMLRRIRERRELTIASSPAAESWMLPIRIGVRRWRIGLTAAERSSLEYALGNAADELIRYPNEGVTSSVRGGIAVLLFDLPTPASSLADIGSRCRQFRQAARRYFYADVDVLIGETVAMRALTEGEPPPEDSEAMQAELDARQRGRRNPSASDKAVLQRIFSYVDEHLPSELKREEIADLVHFHPAYLSRFFKSRTGTSLSQYIVNRRIEKAKTLLTQSELQVSHIVHRLGYDNPSHFTRTFKQATGYTPSQYRSVIVGESSDPARLRD